MNPRDIDKIEREQREFNSSQQLERTSATQGELQFNKLLNKIDKLREENSTAFATIISLLTKIEANTRKDTGNVVTIFPPGKS